MYLISSIFVIIFFQLLLTSVQLRHTVNNTCYDNVSTLVLDVYILIISGLCFCKTSKYEFSTFYSSPYKYIIDLTSCFSARVHHDGEYFF